MVAGAAGSSNRPADHSPAGLSVSQDGGAQQVFRVPAPESRFVEDIRLALEDIELSDAQIEWTVKGLPQYRSLWEPHRVVHFKGW